MFNRVVMLFILSASLCVAQEDRIWTDKKGRTLTGRIVAASDTTISLLINGRTHNVLLDKLSPEDRDIALQWRAKHPAAAIKVVASDAPWPRNHDGRENVAIKTIREDPAQGVFIYETRHFTFGMDRRIRGNSLQQIGNVFESVADALYAFPLNLERAEVVKKQGTRKNKALFFNNEKDYILAGGPPNSVGVFLPKSGDILIRLDMLIHKENKGASAGLPRREEFDVLVHELTHQIMRPWLRYLPPWFVEGIAEYMSATHFSPGRYNFADGARQIKNHLARAVDPKTRILNTYSVESITDMDFRNWNLHNMRAGVDAYRKYITGLLITHYFFHVDSKNGSTFRAYLDAIATGTQSSKADTEILFRKKSRQEVEDAIKAYWNTQGLKLQFHPL